MVWESKMGKGRCRCGEPDCPECFPLTWNNYDPEDVTLEYVEPEDIPSDEDYPDDIRGWS